jgi:hypothetical protein
VQAPHALLAKPQWVKLPVGGMFEARVQVGLIASDW